MDEVPLYPDPRLVEAVSVRSGLRVASLCEAGFGVQVYRGTSLIGKRTPLRPYHRPMSRVLAVS